MKVLTGTGKTFTVSPNAGYFIADVVGPVDIADPDAKHGILASYALLAQLLATDPAAIASGGYNMDLVRFFSLVAKLNSGAGGLVLLLEVTIEGAPSGYRSQVFLLTRTFDANGNPTGYSIVPRDEGENVLRKGSGAVLATLLLLAPVVLLRRC